MAARVSTAEVKLIMDGCTTDSATISAIIDAATLVIDIISTRATFGDDVLKEMEKYLAAHIIASTVFRSTSDEKVGDASVKYTGQWGKRLESTPYGQVLLILDTTGTIASLGKSTASIYAIESFDE